ncbi:MAG: hypothetical protein J6U28_08795 [Bacteroidales bacterium]|nr:hypothetical protein [Bacteroidales bacterium]
MKKFTNLVIAAAMAIGLIGSVTPTKAEAADYCEATNIAEVVDFVKTEHPNMTMSVKFIDGVDIQYSWVWYSKEEVDTMLYRLTPDERAELDAVLEEANATVEDMYGWQLHETTWRTWVTWESLE